VLRSTSRINAFISVFFQASSDELFAVIADLFPTFVFELDFPLDNHHFGFLIIYLFFWSQLDYWVNTGDQLIADETCGPHVALRTVGVRTASVYEHLRSNVVNRADYFFGVWDFDVFHGKAEVNDFEHVLIQIDEYILHFHVPVRDTFLMDVAETETDTLHNQTYCLFVYYRL